MSSVCNTGSWFGKLQKKSDDRYSVVTLIILSSLSVYPMDRGMQGFGDE